MKEILGDLLDKSCNLIGLAGIRCNRDKSMSNYSRARIEKACSVRLYLQLAITGVAVPNDILSTCVFCCACDYQETPLHC